MELKINEKYKLKESNFYDEITLKNKIVIGNTNQNTLTRNGNPDMGFINTWKNRGTGDYKRTAMYSIDLNGEIYKHFPDQYYSDFVDQIYNPQEIVSVALHNEGYLDFSNHKLKYVNWVNKVYTRDTPLNKEWRYKTYWSYYTEQQYESLGKLISMLCDKHKIPKRIMGTNVFLKDTHKVSGVLTRSNYSIYDLDVSPSFDWQKLEESIVIT